MWIENITSDHLWFIGAYLMGSAVTAVILYKSIYFHAIEKTIDGLCESGFLRFRKGSDGDVEILPWNHKDESEELAK